MGGVRPLPQLRPRGPGRGLTTNAIESVNARIRKAVKARGHFPTETAALKCVYLALMSLDPTGRGRQRWMNRWKPALNAFTIAFPGRIVRATK
jgi:putative transposase